MTLDEQCAEIMGHMEPFENHPIPCPDGRPGCMVRHLGRFDAQRVRIPAFSTDPALTPILLGEVTRRRLQWKYLEVLADLLNADFWEPGDLQVVDALELWKLLTATPEQHARAFVKVTEGNMKSRQEVWEESARKLDEECARAAGMRLYRHNDDRLYLFVPPDKFRPIPPFASDRSATWILLAEIGQRGLQHAFMQTLMSIVKPSPDLDDYMLSWTLITATPEQYAQAFVQTVQFSVATQSP